MSWALYLGCTVPVRNLNYEASLRKTADKLGLDLVDLPDFGCCGFPLKSLDAEEALNKAKTNYYSAIVQHLIAKLRLRQVTGTLEVP